MSVSEVTVQDGVLFARSIRALALQAHETLHGAASEQEFQDLLDQIDRLEQSEVFQDSEELTRWLSSLRRVLAEQVMASI